MEIIFIVSSLLGIATIVILGNVLLYKWVINRALKKYIRPTFADLGYTIKNVEFTGLINTGDFVEKGFPIRPFFDKGNPMHTYYVYVYLNKGLNTIRITAKIEMLFLFIRKVEYNPMPKP